MIKFGTDGWRGIIAKDFTFENLAYVALAAAKYIWKNTTKEVPTVVIGYDSRFLSAEFAAEVARILAWKDITVHLANNISSTPQVSYHTKIKNADLGLVITASHNPPEYNGFKVKANFGGPATPDQIAAIEKQLEKVWKKKPKIKAKSIETYVEAKTVKFFDAKESYIRYLKKKINFTAINAANFKILFDPMHGAGINTLKSLIPNIEEIHGEYNPGFGEIDHPEPIAECLDILLAQVKKGKYDFAFATDGDADRVGAVDSDGNFVDSHKIFMILLKYLYEVKKKRGAVAKTVSLTSMVNKFCTKHNINVFETKVGFKYIAELMVTENILIGGEESGGLSTILHIPERDGIFNAMLLLEVMAVTKKSLKQLCSDLDKEFGIHRFARRDMRVTPAQQVAIQNYCAAQPKQIGKFNVTGFDFKDGYKFFVKNGWLLIRSSGTEPLLRYYAEADSLTTVNELLDEALRIK